MICESSPQARYVRFDEVLGKGAYKTVYRAYDTREGVEVAWNSVNLNGIPKHEKARIINEVKLLDKLEHENIIDFYGSWVNREREQVIFVTEIMNSGSLKSFINKVQIIRWKIIKRWCRQILKALEYLHMRKPPIIHRDLKCDNIFINGSSGDIRIGDLGLSTAKKNASSNDYGKGLSVIGTPQFMAPELYEELYDEKVDVYAFGMCALEMMTKDLPCVVPPAAAAAAAALLLHSYPPPLPLSPSQRYSECENHAQIYRKVTTAVLPTGLNRIGHGEPREFIRSCLCSDPSARPTATDLLKHSFLQSQGYDDDEVCVAPPVADEHAAAVGAGESTANAPPPPPRRGVDAGDHDETENYVAGMPDTCDECTAPRVMSGRGRLEDPAREKEVLEALPKKVPWQDLTAATFRVDDVVVETCRPAAAAGYFP